ncbi:MAG: hypothetical protein QNJ16_07235 [Rhodobacter sp.]|nr:hypothetical protein [Rhodobacter sp.]
MTRKLICSLCVGLSAFAYQASAQQAGDASDNTPYAGFESREIKSLSQQDIEEIQRGEGWGLALPAELSGRPGPAHLLEHKDELGLSADQIAAIQSIYEQMLSEAIAAGSRFIAAEAALSKAFEDQGLSDSVLQELIDEASAARAELRFVHLSRHLATPELLTRQQIERYNVLRGYADDPCQNVPAGHNAEMWRRHNNCT